MFSCDEILQRILSVPSQNSWFMFIIPKNQQHDAIEELEESIPIFLNEPVEVISADIGLKNLVEKIDVSDDRILLCHFEAWTDQDWKVLDGERTRLIRGNGGFLLLTPEAAELFQRYAPHFSSFIGAKVFAMELGTEILTESEREHRLELLQSSLGKTNDEVIRLAEIGELPPDPVYGEWLILLDRGEFVG
jgi:hypothetical protein